MKAHVIHWLSVAASALFAAVELCQGDWRGCLNALTAVVGAGVVAHIKLFVEQAPAVAAKVAPLVKAAADGLGEADQMEGPRLAPGTHPDGPGPAAG